MTLNIYHLTLFHPNEVMCAKFFLGQWGKVPTSMKKKNSLSLYVHESLG